MYSDRPLLSRGLIMNRQVCENRRRRPTVRNSRNEIVRRFKSGIGIWEIWTELGLDRVCNARAVENVIRDHMNGKFKVSE